MEYRDSQDEATFRTAVRSFIGANLPQVLRGVSARDARADATALARWRAALGRQGWIAPHWPSEFGGAGLSIGEQFVFNEEMAQARAPEVAGMGVQHIGPVLIGFGTAAQQEEHLPRITSGERVWCQGYSEPGSGSDLASLQTRAIRDGDEYLINGQKIWTSGAHRANWMFMLARTDPDAPKHRGISMFLLDMQTPGVEVRPLISMAGDHVFNEVFFDNVKVPARNLVGDENRGWYVGAALLDFERSKVGAAIELIHTVSDLVDFAREHRSDLTPTIRAELADRAIEAHVGKLISYRVISLQKRGVIPNYEASMNKMFRSEAIQRTARTAVKIAGMRGELFPASRWSVMEGMSAHRYVASMATTIAGGTSEINRNVIATRGLGLPRS